MSAFNAATQMDPTVQAYAESRAREAGMSLSEWLEQLVYRGEAHPSIAGRSDDSWLWTAKSEPARGRTLAVSPDAASVYLDLAGNWHWSDRPTRRTEHSVFDRDNSLAAGSVFALLAVFPSRLDHAAILLSAAFAGSEVSDFDLPAFRRPSKRRSSHAWYDTLVDTCLHRSREVRNALVHRWTPTGHSEHLWNTAFVALADLTPARYELLALCRTDRTRASVELVKYLELATQEFELSANLLAELERGGSEEQPHDQAFVAIRTALLERAGGGLSLTEGAEQLGVSRQALHKRIQKGTALGMMDGDELVVPRCQLVVRKNKTVIVPELGKVVGLFQSAGGWSALQFLIDEDPNLGMTPIQAIQEGRVAGAVVAARAFLGLDET